jgi:hypothetical protein
VPGSQRFKSDATRCTLGSSVLASSAVFLRRHQHQSLVVRQTADHPLFGPAHAGLVQFHPAPEPISARPHHGPTQLEAILPAGLIAGEPPFELQSKGID